MESNSINQNTQETGERPALQQKLQPFNLKHSRRISKLLTMKASKTNRQNQSNEIPPLKAAIEESKQQKQNINNTETKTQEETNSTSKIS